MSRSAISLNSSPRRGRAHLHKTWPRQHCDRRRLRHEFRNPAWRIRVSLGPSGCGTPLGALAEHITQLLGGQALRGRPPGRPTTRARHRLSASHAFFHGRARVTTSRSELRCVGAPNAGAKRTPTRNQSGFRKAEDRGDYPVRRVLAFEEALPEACFAASLPFGLLKLRNGGFRLIQALRCLRHIGTRNGVVEMKTEIRLHLPISTRPAHPAHRPRSHPAARDMPTGADAPTNPPTATRKPRLPSRRRTAGAQFATKPKDQHPDLWPPHH